MNAPPDPRALTLPAPAKLNLYLEILGRRADGYHELLTVMSTLDLCDTLTLSLRPRRTDLPPGRLDLTLTQSSEAPFHGALPPIEGNLALRAAAAILTATRTGDELGLDLTLVKRIPQGAGLGGGSSDAATVLTGAQQLLGQPCDSTQLSGLAAGLGSDVPFFLTGGSCLCAGRGERVQPIDPQPSFEACLLLPPYGVPTPAVYAALAAQGARGPAPPGHLAELRERFAGANQEALGRLQRNDLTNAAIAVEPRLATMLARDGVYLSGSGSALFVLGREVPAFPEVQDIASIACVRTRAVAR